MTEHIDAGALVTEFCGRWLDPDPAALGGYFTDDAIYHNIPLEPVQGAPQIQEAIAGLLTGLDGIDFQIHRQVTDGGLVMNERTDVMLFSDGRRLPLPVMGVFEVTGGRISAWRDYFDLATVTAGFAPGAPSE